jgi:hypothetical protein
MTADHWLAFYLRLVGVVLMLALAAVVMPFEWMAFVHRRLGLGELYESPLTNYLTRSLSALYALHGALHFAVARDVRRHAAVIGFLGWSYLCFGALLLALDHNAGMPEWWILLEGPVIMGSGTIILLLHRRLRPNL